MPPDRIMRCAVLVLLALILTASLAAEEARSTDSVPIAGDRLSRPDAPPSAGRQLDRPRTPVSPLQPDSQNPTVHRPRAIRSSVTVLDPASDSSPPASDPSDAGEYTTRTVSYYSTCGGSHPPVQYTIQIREYKSGASDEESSFYGYDLYSTADDGGLRGFSAVPLQRNPRQDLARWMRGSLYHEDAAVPEYGTDPETATVLREPEAGPQATNSHYAVLASALDAGGASAALGPAELLGALDTLWATRWRAALGLDEDPQSRLLLEELRLAELDAAACVVPESGNSPESGLSAARIREIERRVFLAKEKQRLDAKIAGLRERLQQRQRFAGALVALLRLAPDGGFGPTFEELDSQPLQAAAGRILVDLGPFAAEGLWKGLKTDLEWLARCEHERGPAQTRRILAADAAERLLRDRRLEARAVLAAEWRGPVRLTTAAAIKSCELLAALGADTLYADVLETLPALLQQSTHPVPEAARAARLTLLRILEVRGGKASMEETIGTLAPILSGSDAELARAAHAFLNAHTGQNLPAQSEPWLQLQARMEAAARKTPPQP